MQLLSKKSFLILSVSVVVLSISRGASHWNLLPFPVSLSYFQILYNFANSFFPKNLPSFNPSPLSSHHSLLVFLSEIFFRSDTFIQFIPRTVLRHVYKLLSEPIFEYNLGIDNRSSVDWHQVTLFLLLLFVIEEIQLRANRAFLMAPGADDEFISFQLFLLDVKRCLQR